MGRQASRGKGLWVNPLPWAVLAALITWLLTLWRHHPCQQTVAGQPVDAFMRLCYSDIPILYQNTALGTGGAPYRDAALDQPPLTGLFVTIARALADMVGADPTFGVPVQRLVDGSHLFFLVAAVLLFCCLLATVLSVLLMGRGSAARVTTGPRGRVRSWDALLVAAAPAVVTGGLVSWDLFAVALATAGLLAWALRRQLLAGVLLGLAAAAGTWPLLLLLALLLVCLRAGRVAVWARTAGMALGVWLLVLGIAVLAWTPAALGSAGAWHRRGPELGSVWFVLQELGVRIPLLSLLVAALMLSWCAWVASLVVRAPRRPRVGQVAFLLVAGWLLVNKGYSPQQVLWLLPLVPLARPVLSDWAVWAGAETLYCWAVWGHLGGLTTSGAGGDDVVYWGAIGLRVLVLAWLVAQVAHDVTKPWDDPVREPLVDDPIGGVLDHAPDAVGRPA